jgi:hypothetical protein
MSDLLVAAPVLVLLLLVGVTGCGTVEGSPIADSSDATANHASASDATIRDIAILTIVDVGAPSLDRHQADGARDVMHDAGSMTLEACAPEDASLACRGTSDCPAGELCCTFDLPTDSGLAVCRVGCPAPEDTVCDTQKDCYAAFPGPDDVYCLPQCNGPFHFCQYCVCKK